MWSPEIGRGARQNELGGRGAGLVYNTPSSYPRQLLKKVRQIFALIFSGYPGKFFYVRLAFLDNFCGVAV